MRQPKILMGLTYYLPNISGVTLYAVILAEELVKRKHKVEIVCSGVDRTINRVKVNGIWGMGLGKGIIMPLYFWKANKLVRNNDIILCHLPCVESILLAIWAKIYAKKLVVIHHCEFNFTGTISNKIISIVTYPLHLLVYLMADKITSYTEDYAKTSIFLKYFKNKTNYILPPIKI